MMIGFRAALSLAVVLATGLTATAQVRMLCGLDKASATAKIAVYGAGSGASFSMVHIGDPQKETKVVRVVVEPGQEPVYAVLFTDKPAIWKFEGATERVEQVVVPFVKVGVLGLAREKVAFSPCLVSNTRLARPVDAALLGREPDKVAVTAEPAYGVRLPSVTPFDIDTSVENVPPPGIPPVEWDRVITYYAVKVGQFFDIDPNAVVSRDSVGRYDVLPGYAGIVQLVSAGALALDEPPPSVRHSVGKTYRILKQIKGLPAELPWYSFSFVMAKGVPLPERREPSTCVRLIDGDVTYPITGNCQ